MPKIYGTDPSKYTELADVPPDYTGDAGKLLAVNDTESGVEHRTLATTDVPDLSAAKITTGTLDAARIPNLSASKITSDLIAAERLGTGVADGTKFLRGDRAWEAINSGATVQANPPTATTNAAQGFLVYSQSDLRFYVCIDATTNANVWAYWNYDGRTDSIQRPYPGGTLANAVGANTAPNKVIADTDIFWYIGTNGLTTGYTNPIDGTRIVQTNSGVESGRSSPVVLADRIYSTATAGPYVSSVSPNSWFQLDFGGAKTVSITKVAIQQRGDSALVMHRTLAVQYSSDGVTFTTATTFTATTGQGGWSTFDVTGFPSSRYLRIMHISVDSSGSNYFIASELLLWGAITDA
jgi:hypothetical protein